MDGKSKDLTKEYIEQIKGLFPEAVTEVADSEGNNVTHRVDLEKLALLLGEAAIPTDETEYRQKYGEKFSFEWAGKRRAIAEAQKRSTGTLRPCPDESVEWDTTENLYIEGDNLEVLKLLQDSYLGEVKMIYIDPPYNTGKDFVYKDNYKDNLTNYLEQTNTTNAVNSEASGRYHTNWLNMMYPRLKLARNLLTDDGVIFISIDDNEVSNLKSICDEIFGEDNFIDIFNWAKTETPENLSKKSKQIIEYILCYQKNTTDNKFQGLKKESVSSNGLLNQPNAIGILKFPANLVETSIVDGVIKAGNYGTDAYDVTLMEDTEVYNGFFIKPVILKAKFKWSQIYLDQEIAKGTKIKIPTNKFSPSYEKHEYDPEVPANLINSKVGVGTNENAGNNQVQMFGKKIFSYPKPTSLINYLLSFNDDKKTPFIVLDFFSGSATTAEVVLEINQNSGLNRVKYILVQLPEDLNLSLKLASSPSQKEIIENAIELCNTIKVKPLLTEIAKERIRRAGKKILEEQKAQNGGLFAEEVPKLDIGFKVFKLDRSNVKDWDVEFDGLSEKQAEVQLKAEFSKAMEILKDGRTELDLLYEVMLKLGLQLSSHVSEKEIEGKTAYLVGNGVMVASFAKELTYGQISKILDLKPDFVQAGEFKVVFADESFASDNDKTNAIQLFKQRGITNYEII